MTTPSLSTTALLADAAEVATTLGPLDEKRLWNLIYTLRERATRDVFEAAAAWCASPEPVLRTVGADVLAELGWEGGHPFAKESEPILLALLNDQDSSVVEAAALALGSLGADDTVTICRVAGHPANEVRVALARSLCDLSGPSVIPTLIALSGDADTEVRRLATSGLGGFDREDTETLRLALVARLEDEDSETREEAIFALAQLGDERVEDALRTAQEEPETSELVEMAAMAVESRRHPGRPLPRPN
ncbi:MAG: HEAT repeat domain-containing protein [Vicinamibacteraceae bacterium]